MGQWRLLHHELLICLTFVQLIKLRVAAKIISAVSLVQLAAYRGDLVSGTRDRFLLGLPTKVHQRRRLRILGALDSSVSPSEGLPVLIDCLLARTEVEILKNVVANVLSDEASLIHILTIIARMILWSFWPLDLTSTGSWTLTRNRLLGTWFCIFSVSLFCFNFSWISLLRRSSSIVVRSVAAVLMLILVFWRHWCVLTLTCTLMLVAVIQVILFDLLTCRIIWRFHYQMTKLFVFLIINKGCSVLLGCVLALFIWTIGKDHAAFTFGVERGVRLEIRLVLPAILSLFSGSLIGRDFYLALGFLLRLFERADDEELFIKGLDDLVW